MFGLVISFDRSLDRLDADFNIAGLVAGIFGTKAWMSQLGRKGGQSTSSAKAESSRNNGKKGGRPKKVITNESIEVIATTH